MSKTFVIEKSPYDEGVVLYKKKSITLEQGVTVLVGCNGSGKTTLIQTIQEHLKKEKIPVISFDNLQEGGSKAIQSAAFYNDFAFMSAAATSSEGENIIMNMGNLARILRHFIETGEVNKRSEKLLRAFAGILGEDKGNSGVSNERWILLDAIDSGLSVDNVVDIKEQLFDTIMETKGDKEVYILVTANAYEFCRGEKCFDVYEGKYREFKSYNAYRNFILKSRQKKDARYSK